ncbi:prolyl oligopeptidase family serine peptidase [Alistipes sp. OttesenSCG-928-B03]|nr:prolyl oligopeptidase family serine peptidase [Alistipes sp. OttesenSCG-928-B03]
MGRQIFLFLALIFLPAVSAAQKRPLTADDYKRWRRVNEPVMSDNGRWVTYRYSYTDPEEQQRTPEATHLHDMVTGRVTELGQARDIRFFCRDRWMRYSAGDNIVLYSPTDGRTIVWNREYDFQESVSSPVICYSYQLHDGGRRNRFVAWDIEHGDSTVVENVTRYHLSPDAAHITYLEDDGTTVRLKSGTLRSARHQTIYGGESGAIRDFRMDAQGGTGTFTVASDASRTGRPDLLFAFDIRSGRTRLLLDTRTAGELPGGYRAVASCSQPLNSGRTVFVDVEPTTPHTKPSRSEPATGAEPEIWRWDDDDVPAQGGAGRRTARRPNPRYVYHLDRQQFVMVSEDDRRSMLTPRGDDYSAVLFMDAKPYRRSSDWRDGEHADIWLADLDTGEQTLLFSDFRGTPSWSPCGRFVLFYEERQQVWLSLDTRTRQLCDISTAIGHPMYDEDHDRPKPAAPYGIAGWAADGLSVYLYDRYDIWQADLSGRNAPRALTSGYGRANGLSLRIVGANRDDGVMIPARGELLLKAVDEESKDQSFYRMTAGGSLRRLAGGAFDYHVHALSADGKYALYSRQSFGEYRDLWWSKTDFTSPVRVTDANPHQKEYLWGTAGIVEWRNFDGERNRGLLYLPEGWTPERSYPVIVNFYETHTEELHLYMSPDYSSATIDIPTYVSNGYVVFMPDVRFKTGAPGQSSYSAVVSGTQMLIDKGIATPGRIAIQGHSWSGYQTAYILTRSDIFTCANAGAVVSNMVSAYTAIRPQVGMPRMLMYEETQCRIGQPMWGGDNTELYIRNSPIYFADRIATPLLIFHNDADEAVPYSEGLNLFFAMRRLGKPAWLLNYKGEGHFLFGTAARRDWTIRQEQFFDHYLNGAPRPEWMETGE